MKMSGPVRPQVSFRARVADLEQMVANLEQMVANSEGDSTDDAIGRNVHSAVTPGLQRARPPSSRRPRSRSAHPLTPGQPRVAEMGTAVAAEAAYVSRRRTRLARRIEASAASPAARRSGIGQ